MIAIRLVRCSTCLLAGLLMLGACSPLIAQLAEGTSSSLEKVNLLVTEVRSERTVAIVSFRSDVRVVPSQQHAPEGSVKKLMPLSGVVGVDGVDYAYIVGEFALEKAFTKSQPNVGYVDRRIRVSTLWGGDENYRRLKPILPAARARLTGAKAPKKQHFVAVGDDPVASVLDGQFFGPIKEAEIDDVAALIDLLLQESSAPIPRQKAEELLANRNVWLAYLGLVRLRSLDRLSAEQFLSVIASCPEHRVPQLVEEMFRYTPDTSTEALASFLRDGAPERQQLVLTEVIALVESNTWNACAVVRGSPRLPEILTELADLRRGESGWAMIVAEYDRLAQLAETPD